MAQPVERATFVAAELPQQALIPRRSWLWAALHPPGKPWSRLAPFQGRYHSHEAGPKALILLLPTARPIPSAGVSSLYVMVEGAGIPITPAVEEYISFALAIEWLPRSKTFPGYDYH